MLKLCAAEPLSGIPELSVPSTMTHGRHLLLRNLALSSSATGHRGHASKTWPQAHVMEPLRVIETRGIDNSSTISKKVGEEWCPVTSLTQFDRECGTNLVWICLPDRTLSTIPFKAGKSGRCRACTTYVLQDLAVRNLRQAMGLRSVPAAKFALHIYCVLQGMRLERKAMRKEVYPIET